MIDGAAAPARALGDPLAVLLVAQKAAFDDLPLGGVKPSCMGQYHGPEGFRTLSTTKAVLTKARSIRRALYPPYGGALARRLLDFLMR